MRCLRQQEDTLIYDVGSLVCDGTLDFPARQEGVKCGD